MVLRANHNRRRVFRAGVVALTGGLFVLLLDPGVRVGIVIALCSVAARRVSKAGRPTRASRSSDSPTRRR